MKDAKNELLQFVGGIAMLAVGLFIFSQKVIVHSSWFGYGGFSLAGIRISSGLIIVPLIIGIVWMFATGASFASKVFTGFSVLLIVAAVVMNTNIHLTSMTLYEWVLILVLIFGGVGLTAKVLLADGGRSGKNSKRKHGSGTGDAASDFKAQKDSIDEQLEEMKKNMK